MPPVSKFPLSRLIAGALIDLLPDGENGGEKMTYRERREARAARLREWADKRKQRAGAVLKSHEHYRGDHAFNTQPGHIPERARVIKQEDGAFASLQKADSMNERAGSIEAATDHAIYSDDADAAARLRERIEGLEAERDRIKAYNKSCKTGTPDPSLLDERQQATLRSIIKVTAYSLGKKGEMPGYALTNLSGNIRRYKQRLAQLDAPPSLRLILTRYAGTCAECGASIPAGVRAIHVERGVIRCQECPEAAPRYTIKCDECKVTIGQTDELAVSAAGGVCEPCKLAFAPGNLECLCRPGIRCQLHLLP